MTPKPANNVAASYGDPTIESNVKMIAAVGGLVLLTLIGALVLVQRNLGASQAALSDSVVPTQRALESLTGAVGEMFLRQSKMIASTDASLAELSDRTHHEAAISNGLNRLERLFKTKSLVDHPDFPRAAATALREDIASFLEVDDELLNAVTNYHVLEEQFQTSIEELDSDLRRLMEESSGVAGALRLKYVSMLRRINQGLDNENVDVETIRAAIIGDSRVQLAAIDELDAAVLRLGLLAGKVGLTSTDDAMNSLSANHLAQNRREILSALSLIERLITNPTVVERVDKIRVYAEDLLRRVSDESEPGNLASLRRRMLAEDRRVAGIQEAAARTSQKLSDHTGQLRSFSQDIAVSARKSANATVSVSRRATVFVCLLGLVMFGVAGSRVRTSILGLRLQNERLSNLSRDLAEVNDSLEKTVVDRTAALQLILDSTGEGLVAVNLDGTLQPERSRAVTAWFGTREDSAMVWDYLGNQDSGFSDALEMAFDQIAMDFLPFEVAADQAPSILQRDGRYYSLAFREVREEDELVRVLVIIRDVTAQLEAERAESEAKELQVIINNILQDRDGVQQTVAECTYLIDTVCKSDDQTLVNRALHTLKGNSALVGFQRIAEYVHDLEGCLLLDQRRPTTEELDDLRKRWQSSLNQIDQWLETDGSTVRIDAHELQRLIDLAESGGDSEQIIKMVKSWEYESTRTILKRIANRTKQLGNRLEKPVNVEVVDGSLRVPPGKLDRFWSALVHVVRNAVDHGLERQEDRVAAGKSEKGRVTLSTHRVGEFLEIKVSDDGQGIDWERVLENAESQGIASSTHEDLVAALFHDGLSTRDEATDISGRGVGLSAVRATCVEFGGEVRVESVDGQGTEFVFRFPWDRVYSTDETVVDDAAIVKP